MKQVQCWQADSGRMYANASEALRDDCIVQICNNAGIPYEIGEKVFKHWSKISDAINEYRQYTESK